MFSSRLGRLQFFLQTMALVLVEIVVLVAVIAMTTGFAGLIASKPGPGREGLALGVLIYSIPLAVARANIAWRRWNDAGGKRWVLWAYVFTLFALAVLGAGEFLVHDFEHPDSNIGLGMLGLSSFVLWWMILIKPSRAGGLGGLSDEIDALAGHYSTLEAEPLRMRASAPVYTPQPAGPPVFGKRR